MSVVGEVTQTAGTHLKKYKLLYLCTLLTAFLIQGCASSPQPSGKIPAPVPVPEKAQKERGKTAPVTAKKKKPGVSNLGAKILKDAQSQVGVKYRFGGISPKTGFDCSGLAYWSHDKNGIDIPRVSFMQFASGEKVSKENLRPGDLVFFETYRKGASHVGIYDGKGGFIHSPNSRKTTRRTSLKNPYWKKRYLGARRYWKE